MSKQPEGHQESSPHDHRKLGRELGLFVTSPEIGAGLPLLTEKGAVIRRELEQFQRRLLGSAYREVITPHIAKVSIYERSGHYPYYEESQFPIMEREGERYLLKPMNCPHHIQLYAAEPRSYRDLPYRILEFGTVYRYEQSGEVGGLTRVRALTIDDGHLFVRPDQVAPEMSKLLELVDLTYKVFGFKSYSLEHSYRDPEDTSKYIGTDEQWKQAEEALRNVLTVSKKAFTEKPGEAAFYGPKIDLKVTDSLDREWQLATLQLDFMLPDRFDLTYTDQWGEQQRPVLIHRAIYGSLERFIGILIEHYAGAFPLWLAPVQVKVLPVSDDQIEEAREISRRLEESGIRTELDERSEGVAKKVRDAELEKIPYTVAVGKQERFSETGQVSVRARGGKQSAEDLQDFIARIKAEIEKQS